MAALSTADPHETVAGRAAGTLRGGITAVRLPRIVSDVGLDDVLGADAAWLIIDVRGVDGPVEVALAELHAALSRSGRPVDRTCAVVPGRATGPLATFASLGDACQAKLFFDAGFGTGWSAPTRSLWGGQVRVGSPW